MKFAFTTTLTEFEYDVQPPFVVDTRYAYVPTVSLCVSVVPLPPVATHVKPPLIERSQAIVPVVLDTDNDTLFDPVHTGVAVVNVTVPATGVVVTVNEVGLELTAAHALEVVTRTITG